MECLVAMHGEIRSSQCVGCSVFALVCIFLSAKIVNNTHKKNCDFDLFSEEDEKEDHGGMSSGEESELDQELETSR